MEHGGGGSKTSSLCHVRSQGGRLAALGLRNLSLARPSAPALVTTEPENTTPAQPQACARGLPADASSQLY